MSDPDDPFLRRALDGLRTAVAVLDRAGVIVFVNRAWEAFARDHGAPGTGEPYGPADPGIQEVLEGRSPSFSRDYASRGPDRGRWFRLMASPMDGWEGCLLQQVDITDLKVAEERAKGREDLFQQAFDRNVDPSTLSTFPEGWIVEANRAWCALTGVTREQALGRTPAELGLWTNPQDRTAILEELGRTGTFPGRQVEMRLLTGEIIQMQMSASALVLEEGTRVLLTGRDVTREAALKRTLLATEERFRVITSSLKDYILILDPDGTIAYINRTPVGIPLEAALGMPFPSGMGTEAQVLGEAAFRACLETLAGVNYSAPGIRLDGSWGWFDIRLEPFLAQGELQFVVVLAFDRSDARQAEETELRARKAESLVLMAGSIAHDFNNLFAAIQASLDILAIQIGEKPELVATLATTQEVLHRAITLSWKMNDFSGRAVTHRVPTNLGEVVSAWAARQKPAPGRALTLDLGGVPTILADADRLRIVLDALLENAWEAMDEAGRGGTVALRLFRDLSGEAPPGDWAAPRPPVPETVCLEMANDGPCPAPEVLARMFDPFFTTRFVGRGLGLASVLGLLQVHGAGIQVVPGEGLAFRIHFPPLNP
ncbi:PAS domain-containing sensor histidine kinase [Mesoterricola silvestris]|uniref:Histidine kinase n=1 Tax=Mesoterricola silvestris TaxID=2927979 RepID=A0AA48GX20_9BACT|nr:PAS domain-containing sensor histidine kinase [Mesoterricola silvestris]BDU73441.1 hypothetical protein METEAL_26150 [Mesoterricola silvestris]